MMMMMMITYNRPVLLKGLGALDAGRVVPRALVDVVRRAVGGDGAAAGGARRGVVGSWFSVVRTEDTHREREGERHMRGGRREGKK